MLPWGHAAVGYLVYSLSTRLRHRRPPAAIAVLALAVGTQLPDLVDKPLAWTFGVLPSGRSLAHSVFALAIIGGVVLWIGHQRDAFPAAEGFVVGWASHLLADGYTLLLGESVCLRYLGWPLVACAYEADHSFLQFFLTLDLHAIWPGVALAGVAGTLWLAEGAPGVRYLVERLQKL